WVLDEFRVALVVVRPDSVGAPKDCAIVGRIEELDTRYEGDRADRYHLLEPKVQLIEVGVAVILHPSDQEPFIHVDVLCGHQHGVVNGISLPPEEVRAELQSPGPLVKTADVELPGRIDEGACESPVVVGTDAGYEDVTEVVRILDGFCRQILAEAVPAE